MNRAQKYFSEGKYHHALREFDKIIAKEPNNKLALLDAGAACFALGRPELAYDYTLRAVRADPTFDMAYSNIALYKQMIGRPYEAIEWYTQAIALGYREAEFNRSLQYLKIASTDGTGWQFAFNEYEHRFTKQRPVPMPNVLGRKRWDGTGKVLVVAEQGVGDDFMFSRYLPCIDDYDFLVPAELDGLFPNTVTSSSASDAEYYIPMGSLPMLFGPLPCPVQNIPLGTEIGVCWRGNSGHQNDVNRSYPSLRRPMLEMGSLNLQFGDNPDIKTWQDTIDLIDKCHTVISVDTSIVHIAALRGRRVMLLQPLYDWDWRWGIDGETVWYDNIEQYSSWKELCVHI